MYTVLRRYNDRVVVDAVNERQADVEAILRGVPGFISYQALRSGTGGITITTCDDQAGTTESSRRAAEYVRENIPAAAGGSPPEITEGEVFLHFKA
jgi:hypothetical protein